MKNAVLLGAAVILAVLSIIPVVWASESLLSGKTIWGVCGTCAIMKTAMIEDKDAAADMPKVGIPTHPAANALSPKQLCECLPGSPEQSQSCPGTGECEKLTQSARPSPKSDNQGKPGVKL